MNKRYYLSFLTILFSGTLVGCFRAPLELQQAIRTQHNEIVQVRAFYNDAVGKLFDEIEELQLHYIDQFESEMIAKYKFKRGGEPGGTVASDDDLNVVLVPIQARIHAFAEQRRALVRQNIANMKRQYLAMNQSLDNIDKVNQDMTVYVDSLIRYRKAQNALGQALLRKVSAITPANLPTPSAIGQSLKTFESDFAKAAQSFSPAQPQN